MFVQWLARLEQHPGCVVNISFKSKARPACDQHFGELRTPPCFPLAAFMEARNPWGL